MSLFLHPASRNGDGPLPVQELAIAFALAVKLNWLVGKYNVRRMESGLLPRDCAVGIHSGRVAFRRRNGEGSARSEGFGISLAKRIVGEAKKGLSTRVFVTSEFHHSCGESNLEAEFSEPSECKLKGIPAPIEVREVKSLGLAEFSKKTSTGLAMDAANPSSESWRWLAKTAQCHQNNEWLVTLAMLPLFQVLNNNNTNLVIERMNEVLKVWHGCPEAHCHLASAYTALERYQEAAEAARKAIMLKPRFAEAHTNLGVALQRLGRTDEAVAALTEAVSLKPASVRARNALGVAYRSVGRLDDALREFEEAVRLNHDSAEAHVNLGSVYLALERFEDAADELTEAISIDQKRADAHFNLGAALDKLGRPEEAVKAFKEAIRLKPGCAELHRQLGMALAGAGSYEKAVGELHEAVQLDPGDAEARAGMARAYAEMGEYSAAVREYRESIRLSPDDIRTRNSLGTLFFGERHFHAAAAEFKEAIRIKPDDPESRTNLAWVFVAMEEYGKAIGECTDVLRANPAFAHAYFIRAIANERFGNRAQAEEDYARACHLDEKYVATSPSNFDGWRTGKRR